MRIIGFAALGILVLVGGCGSVTGAAAPSAAPKSDLHGAPNVPTPLKADKFQSDPCASIAPSQVKQLKSSVSMGNVSKQRFSAVGKACRWDGGGTNAAYVSVSYLSSGQGLASLYGNKSDYQVWDTPAPIDGHPVVHNSLTKASAESTCNLTVGLNNNLAMSVSYSFPEASDNCAAATTVAASVLKTIKAGQ